MRETPAVTLVLTNDHVAQLLTMRDVLEVLEYAYREMGRGRGVVRDRTHTFLPHPDPGREYEFKSMEGGLQDPGVYALRIASDVLEHPVVDGKRRRVKVPALPGGRWLGLILLFRIRDGALLAILQDGLIQGMRVAATSALAARHLARPESRVMGLIGSGWQAKNHVLAMSAVFALAEVRVWSPTVANRERFAAEMTERAGVPVRAVDGPDEAVRGADLVCVATNSSEPVLKGRWLEPGQFVSSIVGGDERHRRRELDDEVLRRAHRVVVQSRDHAQRIEQEDLHTAVAAGYLRWQDVAELAEVVAGRAPGRRSPGEITVFKNNVGLGIQFAAVAHLAYQRAVATNLGHTLPLEWFTQTIHP
ncbi:MAG: ornithine cyclodeaminase family protein [Armatimonadota bacterium]|nr:ornithine cyclodeaminase family protein [Armatimonadota bacterium]